MAAIVGLDFRIRRRLPAWCDLPSLSGHLGACQPHWHQDQTGHVLPADGGSLSRHQTSWDPCWATGQRGQLSRSCPWGLNDYPGPWEDRPMNWITGARRPSAMTAGVLQMIIAPVWPMGQTSHRHDGLGSYSNQRIQFFLALSFGSLFPGSFLSGVDLSRRPAALTSGNDHVSRVEALTHPPAVSRAQSGEPDRVVEAHSSSAHICQFHGTPILGMAPACSAPAAIGHVGRSRRRSRRQRTLMGAPRPNHVQQHVPGLTRIDHSSCKAGVHNLWSILLPGMLSAQQGPSSSGTEIL